MTYAQETRVSIAKSKTDIERTLTRWGADQFIMGWEGDSAAVGFRINGRQVKMIMPIPPRSDFTESPAGHYRSEGSIESAWQQGQRARWRGLLLIIKAKLEAVEAGIVSFDEEFLAHVVLPSGETVGRWAVPQVEIAYETGHMPSMLITDGRKGRNK